MEKEKEIDGNYADDDHEEVPAQDVVLELTFSQKLYQLSARLKRFAESIENEPSWHLIRKKLCKK